jgi:hypothetical protein
MTRQNFASIAELMDAYEGGEIRDEQFDDDLWLMVLPFIAAPSDRERYGDPVLAYFGSRLMQWEVGNGGFAQAAYNYPEWFETAAWGYDAIGVPRAAALIREAMPLLSEEGRETTFNADEIGELFEQFAESKLAQLDGRLDECGWWATQARLRYVRQNSAAFRAIG